MVALVTESSRRADGAKLSSLADKSRILACTLSSIAVLFFVACDAAPDEARSRFPEMTSVRERVASQISSFEDEYRQLRSERDRLRREVDRLRDEQSRYERERRAALARSEALRAELASALEDLTFLERSLAAALKRRREVQRELEGAKRKSPGARKEDDR